MFSELIPVVTRGTGLALEVAGVAAGMIGARAAFSYGAARWFPAQLAHWCMTHHVTGAAITDGLIFMAVTMIVTRTVGLAVRAAALPDTMTGDISVPDATGMASR
jgi:hypothetical protein